MPRTFIAHPDDVVGYSRLAIDAVLGLTDLVETEHHNISRAPGMFGRPAQGGADGITGLVYKGIRGVTKLVGSSLNVSLAPLLLLSRDPHSTPEREAALAVLNGILGEHLYDDWCAIGGACHSRETARHCSCDGGCRKRRSFCGICGQTERLGCHRRGATEPIRRS